MLGKETGELMQSAVRQNENIEISEETFRSAMEYASIGMALVDLNGAWLKVNRSICNLLGYTEDELMVIDFQSITHPEDLGQDLQYVQQLLDKRINTYQMEKRYFHKDGHIIWVLLSVSLMWDENDKPRYFISQIQDITKQKEVDRIKSEFISVVSHELRTPLTSIRGSLGLLTHKMSDGLTDKANRLMQIAYENTERVILLINDILDIDKIAAGQMRFDLKEHDLNGILQEAAEANQAYLEKYNVSLNIVADTQPVKIKVDAARLMQVLSNFLSNAAKFSPENEVVTLSLAVKGNVVRIAVKDNGMGIPESFKPKIFSKFSQADSSLTRAKAGTGLGLHISKEIVEHMGGTIGFESELNQGSEFWIEFPLTENIQQPVQKETVIAAPVSGRNDNLPLILHIEDDVSLIEVFANALADKAKVVPATSLSQARALLGHHQFSMIILDMIMPDGFGSELLLELKQSNQNHVPVMILSALEAPETLKKMVVSHMVKSRMSEATIIEKILDLVHSDKKEHHV